MALAKITSREQQKVGEHHAQRSIRLDNADSDLKSYHGLRLFSG
jgi:hypothetical protein